MSYNIARESFPLVTTPTSEKFSEEYGLQVGQAIQGEWFRRGNKDARFYDNRNEFQKLRLYARGEQPIGKYKRLLAYNGDLSYLNLDFSIVPIIPKFVDVVANGMVEREYRVKAEGQDDFSTKKKTEYKKSLEKDMMNKEFLLEAQAALGVNGFANPPELVPDNEEELEVQMERYKDSLEVAQEIAVEAVLQKNRFESIRRRVAYDLVVLGMGVGRHDFCPRKGISLSYVDPEQFIYSYTETPDFSDCYYFGEVSRESIDSLRVKYQLSDKQVREIRDNAIEWHNYHHLNSDRVQEFSGHVCNVLTFTYKTEIDTKVWKKKTMKDGSVKYIEKDVNWNPPADKLRGSERVTHREEVWFEGQMVLGTDIMLDWKLSDYSLKPKSKHNKPIPKYVGYCPRMYEDRIESLTKRMIPFGDAVQLQHLKLQQVASRVLPDGVYLDADGLVEINLGNGESYNPAEALKMFMQTGSVIGRSSNTMSEYNHGSIPIKEIQHSSGGSKIQALIEQYNFNLQRLRDVTGINEVRDGSTPDSDMLVGVQEMAVLNSNTATMHIMSGLVEFTRCMSEGVSYRIADILKDPEAKKQFKNEIGRGNVTVLEELDKLHLRDFGIYIELAPDALERERIEKDIAFALEAQQITIEDANVIRDIKNFKTALRYLGVKIRKREEEIHLRNQENIRVQAEEQAKIEKEKQNTAQIKAQAEAQKLIAVERVKGEEERRNKEFEAQQKLILMAKEYEYAMGIEGAKAQAQRDVDKYKNDRADKRQDKQNTANSTIADQRATGKPPINFESEEDSLDGFGLESFGRS